MREDSVMANGRYPGFTADAAVRPAIRRYAGHVEGTPSGGEARVVPQLQIGVGGGAISAGRRRCIGRCRAKYRACTDTCAPTDLACRDACASDVEAPCLDGCNQTNPAFTGDVGGVFF